MSRIKKVDLVIPVYNEEVNLPRLFDRLRADLASLSCAWRVIFVDDGSHDRSQPHAVKSLVLPSSRGD